MSRWQQHRLEQLSCWQAFSRLQYVQSSASKWVALIQPPCHLPLVADHQRRFTEVFAHGTNEEKRTVARCFVKKIEVDPDTGNVLMYLFSGPPAATIPEKSIGTPPGSRVPIGLVAGPDLDEQYASDLLRSPSLNYSVEWDGPRVRTKSAGRTWEQCHVASAEADLGLPKR